MKKYFPKELSPENIAYESDVENKPVSTNFFAILLLKAFGQ
jgi:hypothetical protein